MTNPFLHNQAADIDLQHVEGSWPWIAAEHCQEGLQSGIHDLQIIPDIL